MTGREWAQATNGESVIAVNRGNKGAREAVESEGKEPKAREGGHADTK
jgi:hypothetical protein